jgi:hypothetical protein
MNGCKAGKSKGTAPKVEKRKRRSYRMWNWDRLFARKTFQLRPGVDYFCKKVSACVYLRRAAWERGLHASIDEGEGGVLNVSIHERPLKRGPHGGRTGGTELDVESKRRRNVERKTKPWGRQCQGPG